MLCRIFTRHPTQNTKEIAFFLRRPQIYRNRKLIENTRNMRKKYAKKCAKKMCKKNTNFTRGVCSCVRKKGPGSLNNFVGWAKWGALLSGATINGPIAQLFETRINLTHQVCKKKCISKRIIFGDCFFSQTKTKQKSPNHKLWLLGSLYYSVFYVFFLGNYP